MRALPLVLVAATAEATPKKDLELAAKTPTHATAPPPGTKPAALVNLFNEHTHEWLAVDPAVPPSGSEVDEFLRDHYTNKPTRMDPKLVAIVVAAAQRFHAEVVHVVSGFRHPKYNLILRKKGHQVARDSEHTLGQAIDFFLPGVSTRDLQAWAKLQKLGGVGIYLESGFVHMDTGRIRYWSGD
jgi:uncharacterized protein YcbK (DUF882 family)